MVDNSGTNGSKMILVVLKSIFGGMQVWDSRLEPGKTNLCITLSLFEENFFQYI